MANGVAEGLYGSMEAMIAHGITAQDFATMAMIMTIAICSGGVEVLFFYRLYQPKIGKLMAKTTGGKKIPIYMPGFRVSVWSSVILR